MLSLARPVTQRTAASRSFISFYSTVTGLVRTNWRTGSHPAPQPATAVSTESDDSASADADDYEDSSLAPKAITKRKPGYFPPTSEPAKAHRAAMKKAFPQGWSPPRKLSREAMDALRALHATEPEVFTTPLLASKFRISPEAVRRILKSKWEPSQEERVRMAERERRHREEWLKQKRQEEAQRRDALVKVMKKRAGKKERKNDGLMFK